MMFNPFSNPDSSKEDLPEYIKEKQKEYPDIEPKDIDKAFERISKRAENHRKKALEDPIEWPPKKSLIKEWESFGLKCALARGSFCVCGYVYVPKNHPDADAWYDDVDVDVYGGLTFRCRAMDGGSWFGFDTNHLGDWWGYTVPDHPELNSEHPGRIWTVEDVEKETIKLAEQLAKRGKK